jgi:hypothetical protein
LPLAGGGWSPSSTVAASGQRCELRGDADHGLVRSRPEAARRVARLHPASRHLQ